MTVALKFFFFSFLKIAIRFWNGVMTRKLLISFLDLLICGKGDCEIYMLKMNLVKTHFQVVGAIRPGGGEFPERVGQPVCQVCGVNVFFFSNLLELKESCCIYPKKKESCTMVCTWRGYICKRLY